MSATTSNVDIRARVRGGRSSAAQLRRVRAEAEMLGVRGSKALGAFAAQGAKMRDFGRTMTRNVSLPLGLAAAAVVKFGMGFEDKMSSLSAVVDGGARALSRLRAQALKAGTETAYSATEAASAQIELAKGGISAQKILSGGLTAALNMAAAGEMSLADAASTTANALNLFKMKGSEAGKVADAFAVAAAATTADVADFAMALSQGGSVAKMAGMSFSETMVALEALAKAGIKNSDAGTSLKSFLLKIGNPSLQARKAMDKLNLSLFTQSGRLKSLPALASALRGSFGKLTKQQFLQKAGTIAGSDAARTLYSIYAAGAGTLKQYAKDLGAQGAASEMARKKQDNFKGAVKKLNSAMQTSAIILATHVLPTLSEFAQTAAKVVGSTTRWFEGLSSPVQTSALAFGALLFATGPLAYAFSFLATAAGRWLKVLIWLRKAMLLANLQAVALKAAYMGLGLWFRIVAAAARMYTIAQWALNVALTANPIGVVVMAIAAFVGALVIAYLKITWFRNFVNKYWPLIIGVFTGGLAVLVILVIRNFGRIVAFVRRLPGRIARAASGMWDGFKSAFKSAINWIIRGWNSLEFKVPAINMGPLGKLGGFTAGTPDIQPLARGGWMRGFGSALVGDAGPELLTLTPSGAAVEPLGHAPAAARAAGGAEAMEIRIYLDSREITDSTAHRVRVVRASR